MENALYDIETRTFGVEIEMCDFDRSKVTLPEGFEWNKDEQIYNTDAFCSKDFGGEINTPPMRYTKESLEQIKFVYDQLIVAGGRLKWSIDTHVHIYAGDLSLEQLKNLALFEYITYPYFGKFVNIAPWDEITLHARPQISETKYREIKNAQTFNELKTLLTNQSKKGFVRYAINIASYFVRKTIEFRCYHATEDFHLVENCIEATYKMFYYAINHTEADFLAIQSYEDFIATIGLPTDGMPPTIIPLIYQGNPYSAQDAYKTKPITYNAKLGSSLQNALMAHNCKSVALVNSYFYQYELALYKKFHISIYNQDEYSHLLYELSTGQKQITYCNNLEWLQQYNSDRPERQVAIALYVFKIMKFVAANNDYKKNTMEAYKLKAEESINRTEQSAKELITMLTNADYHYGTLDDALENEKAIFFSFGRYKKSRRAFRTITDNSNYETDQQPKRTSYYALAERIPRDTIFLMFSDSPYLSNLHKIAYFRTSGIYRESCGRFLYCNKTQKDNKAAMSYSKAVGEVSISIPPDDLLITDPQKLGVYSVPSGQFYSLQKTFIKKVDKVSQAAFAFVVMYDKYCLGGIAYDFAKNAAFDLWQLSDFCTNNNVPRLSKLILLCALSKPIQRMLSRKLGRMINKVITYAYTDAPVSMKYRGLYKKDNDFTQPHKLAYVGTLGTYATMEDIVNKYQNYIQNAGK